MKLTNQNNRKSAGSLPFVTVKFAQTLDGRIATASGDSRWISSPAARRFVHRLRSQHDAIMVGIGTVLADDPELTVRLVKGRDPLRIIIDSKLKTPLTARVLAGDSASHTLIATVGGVNRRREKKLEALGAAVLRLPVARGSSRVDLAALLSELGERGVSSVLVEGGQAIITSLLSAGLADRLVAIVAPKIIGAGIEAVGDLGIRRLNQAITFSSFNTRRLGTDIVIDARLK